MCLKKEKKIGFNGGIGLSRILRFCSGQGGGDELSSSKGLGGGRAGRKLFVVEVAKGANFNCF